MYAMFIDESGDHSLDVIDPQYPVFVLGGCIMELAYHQEQAEPEVGKYKRELFQRDDFILHTADIARRRGVFRRLTDRSFREHFYQRTNLLMGQLDYQVVACAIKKDQHLRKYGLAALDPYLLSLNILVERFVYELEERDASEGVIIAESRDETLDNQLRLSWMELRTSGTQYVSASRVRQLIPELHIRKKSANIAGLQIADLIVSPIGRRVIGKPAKQDWEVIASKFRKDQRGNYMGYGLVVLPRPEKKGAAPE